MAAPTHTPVPDLPLREALARIAEREDLDRDAARAALSVVMQGLATGAQIGAFLMGLRMKGETIAELAGAAEAMADAATPVRTRRRPLLDTCGTGGDRSQTPNLSTAVGLVCAAAGAPVAKHGNRSVSSRSGSADVLEAAGLKVDLTAEQMERCLDETGFAFLFAPLLHPAMRHAIGPRREMGLRTLFNLLGPLTNPARPEHQLLGVYDLETARRVAGVRAALGGGTCWVVHGLNGWDELSIAGESAVFRVSPGEEVEETRLRPEDAGLRAREVRAEGGTPEENARWLEQCLRGQRDDATGDAVLLNAAAALGVCGRAPGLTEGVALAREAVGSGRAAALLERLRRLTHEI